MFLKAFPKNIFKNSEDYQTLYYMLEQYMSMSSQKIKVILEYSYQKELDLEDELLCDKEIKDVKLNKIFKVEH